MDMCIDETLRLYPPFHRVERKATADYEYEGMRIRKAQIVSIPLYALHYDEDLFPNAHEFQPERFSDESKMKREKEAFLTFGAGPRHCIGMRFALMTIKLFYASILSKYRFEKCEKTTVNSLV
jgi:cytochrome P450 family 3 subfamily A